MIRTLGIDDVDQFIGLRTYSLINEPMSFGSDPHIKIDREKTIQDFQRKNEENFILGYFDQTTLIGFLGFIRYTNCKTRHKAFVWGVYVSENYRGNKIGNLLLESCINRAQQLEGLTKILLGASHISEAAIGMYKKFGFKEYGREKNAMIWEGKSIDEILMERYI
ncbi:MAG: GNAT family N-acetyltransferase [Saprospiraceae bacterium]|nr:GNAT family N-acetyltransferase [Saprospiraceae bacterium]